MKLKQNIASCSASYKYDNVIIMNRKETTFFDDYNENELKDVFVVTDMFSRFHIRYITEPIINKYEPPREYLAIYFDSSDGFDFDLLQVTVKLMSA